MWPEPPPPYPSIHHRFTCRNPSCEEELVLPYPWTCHTSVFNALRDRTPAPHAIPRTATCPPPRPSPLPPPPSLSLNPCPPPSFPLPAASLPRHRTFPTWNRGGPGGHGANVPPHSPGDDNKGCAPPLLPPPIPLLHQTTSAPSTLQSLPLLQSTSVSPLFDMVTPPAC